MINDEEFISNYLNRYISVMQNCDVSSKIIEAKQLINNVKDRGNKIAFFGNGASASIASHAALDFKKQAQINTLCLNNATIITAYANDYGYEKWIIKAVESYCKPGDTIVLISSSGNSPNIVNAAKYIQEQKDLFLITFSGFAESNSIIDTGNINFWVDSKGYNIIENIHQIWLMLICDIIIGKVEYSVS